MKLNRLPETICLIVFIFLPFAILLLPTATMAASLTISWTPNEPQPEGYCVFARRDDQLFDFSRPTWQGNTASCTLDELEAQTEYYFVVQAYDGIEEGDLSQEIHYVPATNDLERQPGMMVADEVDNVARAPSPPRLRFPAPHSRVGFNPRLKVGDYLEVDGMAQSATQWQIFETGSGNCLLDLISDRLLTRLKVPNRLLDGGRTYHWRVRFFGDDGQVSVWSAVAYFEI